MGSDLSALLLAQQRGCRIGGSALYDEVLGAVLADVEAGGPCGAALAPYADEPTAAAVVLRFLAAVHELVLSGEADDLAGHYPSAGGRPGAAVGDAFVATVAAHLDRVRERTGRPIQTNEAGRSAALLGGYLVVSGTGLPLRVLEIGASAGLNLRFDRFRYEGRTGRFGPAGAPVRFVRPWTDAEPRLDAPLRVAERAGCDLDPVDPRTPEGRLRLRACLWPDQPHRRERLEGALRVAAEVPVRIDRAEATGWLRDRLAEPVEGVATVVVHSIVAQYLGAEGRAALEEVVTAAGERATLSAPVAWLRLEPATVDEAEVRLSLWPRPSPVAHHVLARCGFHGPPVRWAAPRATRRRSDG
ncbi:MAG: DUF2332 domain-containing protein [Acidimicrobiales bacterium]|nr:DUF2332 domain-containing protein [Acidimicrobiales bacterium]